MRALVIISPFGGFGVGEIIKDKQTIDKIISSGNQSNVVVAEVDDAPEDRTDHQ